MPKKNAGGGQNRCRAPGLLVANKSRQASQKNGRRAGGANMRRRAGRFVLIESGHVLPLTPIPAGCAKCALDERRKNSPNGSTDLRRCFL
ncbi:hypothetical protein K8I61_08715 [bacterium]|nr:hypothetical protein [bacterium]